LQHRVPVLWEIHKVHHTAEVLTPFTNDWLFGTLYVPERREELTFGIPGTRREHAGLVQAWVRPIVNMGRLIAGAGRRGETRAARGLGSNVRYGTLGQC